MRTGWFAAPTTVRAHGIGLVRARLDPAEVTSKVQRSNAGPMVMLETLDDAEGLGLPINGGPGFVYLDAPAARELAAYLVKCAEKIERGEA